MIRDAGDDDEAFLADLFFDVRSDELAIAGLQPEQLKSLVAMQYQSQRLSYSSLFPNAEHSIIKLNGEKIGRLLVNRTEKHTHLIDIAILEDFRGIGVGSFVLEKLKTAADVVTLSVFKTNAAAIRLYEKHGFRVSKDAGMYAEMEWKNAE